MRVKVFIRTAILAVLLALTLACNRLDFQSETIPNGIEKTVITENRAAANADDAMMKGLNRLNSSKAIKNMTGAIAASIDSSWLFSGS